LKNHSRAAAERWLINGASFVSCEVAELDNIDLNFLRHADAPYDARTERAIEHFWE
jgi:hypothetical protein